MKQKSQKWALVLARLPLGRAVGAHEGDEARGDELGVGGEAVALLVECGHQFAAAGADRVHQPPPGGELFDERLGMRGEAAATTIAW